MLINMLVFIVLFFTFARIIKRKIEPSEQFFVRWLKACLVAALSTGAYLLVVSIKEGVLFTVRYRELIETGQLGLAQWLWAVSSSAIWPVLIGVLAGPILLAMIGWNRPSVHLPSET